jgi:DNA-binding NtrC family response regulator
VDLGNILVVDDEEAIREVVSTMLESRGYHCTAVGNGRAAQECVRKETPDLILSDMIMPEMDGIKLLDWMRGHDPEVPVIMVTAIHDISTALEAIRRGAYDYILKPFEKDQLFHGVGRAIQHRRLVVENRNYQRDLELKGRGNRGALPAGDRLHDFDRKGCAGADAVPADSSSRRVLARHRQNGYSRFHPPEAGAAG